MCCGRDKTLINTYEESRSCTDIIFLLIFIAFWIAFFVIGGIGFSNGDPDRLLYGTDYLGLVCGKGTPPSNFTNTFAYITNPRWQSKVWSENRFMWYPVGANTTSSVSDMFDYGVCVKECPTLDNVTLTNLTATRGNPDSVSGSSANGIKVYTYGHQGRKGDYIWAPDLYYVYYSSDDMYRRCLPKGLSMATLNQTLNAIPAGSKTTQFFVRGISELAHTWRVFLIIGFLALVMCFIYIFIMRFIIRILTYTVLILLLCLICLIGAMMLVQANNLENKSDGRNDEENARYVKAWRYGGYIVFGLALVFLIMIIWFKKRIDTACALVKVAGRVLHSAPLMVLIPPWIFVFIVLLVIWCIFVAVYLYTCDTFENAPYVPMNNSFASQYLVNATQTNLSKSYLQSDNAKRNLLFYDLFGFLWTMGFFNAIGYTIIAFVSVQWYFSDVENDKKAVPSWGIWRATWWTLVFHLGTMAVGSFVVAVVQFLQFLLYYVEQTCQWAKDNSAVKCILCCAECCLLCIERIVKIISKNAYIMMCITSECFFWAARDAFNYILDNAATIAVLNVIVESVMFLGKLLIVLGCLVVGWRLMDYPDLAPDVETKILPIIVLGFIVYFICAVFFNVYSTTIDACFLCMVYDKDKNAAKGVYFIPKELELVIEDYDSEQAAKDYKAKQQAKASGQPYPREEQNKE